MGARDKQKQGNRMKAGYGLSKLADFFFQGAGFGRGVAVKIFMWGVDGEKVKRKTRHFLEIELYRKSSVRRLGRRRFSPSSIPFTW